MHFANSPRLRISAAILLGLIGSCTAPLAAQAQNVVGPSESKAVVAPQPVSRAFIEAAMPRLKANWAKQQQDVGGVRIRYREAFVIKRWLAKDATHADVEIALRDFDLTAGLTGLENFLAAFPEKDGVVRPTRWTEKELFQDGKRRRVDGGGSTQVVDGDWSIYVRSNPANSQIDLYRGRVAIQVMSQDELRFRLQPIVEKSILDGKLQPMRNQPGSICASSFSAGRVSRVDIEFDDITGDCLRFVSFDARSNPTQLIAQRGFKIDRDGISYPGYHIRATFSNGQLRSMQILQIIEAQFHVSLPADKFVVPAQVGDVIVDYGRAKDNKSKIVFKVNRSAKDVRLVLPWFVPPEGPTARRVNSRPTVRGES